MRVNQVGQPVREDRISWPGAFKGEDEVAAAVLLLVEHLGLDLVRTNATKHGADELRLRREGYDV